MASSAGTHFDDGRPGDADPVERLGSRPDFQMLVYPVVTMGEKSHALSKKKLLGEHPAPELVRLFSNEEQVTPRTPPAFLAHAKDDSGVVPEQPGLRPGAEGAGSPGGVPGTSVRQSRPQRLQGPALGAVEGGVAEVAGSPGKNSE